MSAIAASILSGDGTPTLTAPLPSRVRNFILARSNGGQLNLPMSKFISSIKQRGLVLIMKPPLSKVNSTQANFFMNSPLVGLESLTRPLFKKMLPGLPSRSHIHGRNQILRTMHLNIKLNGINQVGSTQTNLLPAPQLFKFALIAHGVWFLYQVVMATHYRFCYRAIHWEALQISRLQMKKVIQSIIRKERIAMDAGTYLCLQLCCGRTLCAEHSANQMLTVSAYTQNLFRPCHNLVFTQKLESSILPYLLKNVGSWKQSEVLVIPSVKHLDSGHNRNGGPVGDGVMASASEVNALKDSFSALDVGVVADIKTEDTVKQTPAVGITDCKCGMPLCICQVSATPTTSIASQERTYLLAFKCFLSK
uniref:Uncharacterized protein n=1 Tax=Solanum lycopersicum TaxID=4081 RepID=A0A3Q7GTE4_SOLLC